MLVENSVAGALRRNQFTKWRHIPDRCSSPVLDTSSTSAWWTLMPCFFYQMKCCSCQPLLPQQQWRLTQGDEHLTSLLMRKCQGSGHLLFYISNVFTEIFGRAQWLQVCDVPRSVWAQTPPSLSLSPSPHPLHSHSISRIAAHCHLSFSAFDIWIGQSGVLWHEEVTLMKQRQRILWMPTIASFCTDNIIFRVSEWWRLHTFRAASMITEHLVILILWHSFLFLLFFLHLPPITAHCSALWPTWRLEPHWQALCPVKVCMSQHCPLLDFGRFSPHMERPVMTKK